MNKSILFIFVALLCYTCKTSQKSTTSPKDDGIIEVTFLQMNDVYEISPTLSDNRGGLARVATIRKELLAKNPNTFTLLSGDFISPSVIGTLKYEGKRIRGKQMVETLNVLGLDWVVFGNHEFDYDDPGDLQARLDESNFTWFGANVRYKAPTASGAASVWTQQFFKNKAGGGTDVCPDNQVINLKDADGTSINLGVFGVLLDSGRKPYVEYSNWFESAQKNYTTLDPKTDVVVALTHLNIEDDLKLASMLPQVPLFMGGHDHDNMIHKVGNATVAKADANAKTVYIHTLIYNKNTGKSRVTSRLIPINGDTKDDPATLAVVNKWEKIKNESLETSGFNASQPVIKLTEPLDCRDAITRAAQAPVGKIITDAMLAVSKNKPDCAILNGGSIRVDDVLSGTLTELDIVRMLPFGGAIVEVEMSGTLLKKTLETGTTNKGTGGYLQLNRVSYDNASSKWIIDGKPLDASKVYHVTMPDFLLTGSELNMGYLKASLDADGKSTNTDITKIIKPDSKNKNDLRNDVRLAVIRFLQGE